MDIVILGQCLFYFVVLYNYQFTQCQLILVLHTVSEQKIAYGLLEPHTVTCKSLSGV